MKMIPSTEQDILKYFKDNACTLSAYLPASISFTNRIKCYNKHLNNVLNKYFFNESMVQDYWRFWCRDVEHFLENLYLPQHEWYNNLEKLYTKNTNKKISRAIQGEVSNYIEERQDECHVCVNAFSNRDIHLSCGHWICKECIINSGNEKCPICKRVVSLTLKEVKELNIKKEKMRLEKEREERLQIISSNLNAHERLLEETVNNYLTTLNLRDVALMTAITDHMSNNFQNLSSTYYRAREIVSLYL